MCDFQSNSFDSDPATYHRYTAYVLAQLSAIVYNFENELQLLAETRDLRVNFKSVSPFGPTGDEAFIFESEQCIMVVWRGTRGLSDWEDNLNLNNVPYEICGVDGKIKEGFWKHTERAWKEGIEGGVSAKLKQLTSGNNRKVFFTGHSLGGACALVSACRFIKEQNGLQKLAQIVTTGQPRTVCHKIAEFLSTKLKDKYIRFVDSADPVPQLPGPVLKKKGWDFLSHGGTLKFIIRSEPAIYTDPSRLFSAPHTARDVPIGTPRSMPNNRSRFIEIASTARKIFEGCKREHRAHRYPKSILDLPERDTQ